jgi:hypothetical protein
LNFIGIKAAATAWNLNAWQAAPRPAIPILQRWDISVLHEAGTIREGECEEHGWKQDRPDPHARERAFIIARHDPPPRQHRWLGAPFRG